MDKKLQEKYEKLFEPQIVFRGIDYYKKQKVLNVFKVDGKEEYTAFVEGTDDYEVNIKIEDDDIDMHCTCPYDRNCKHEYATLMYIDMRKNNIQKILDVPDKNVDIEEFIKNIPEEELKEYLIEIFDTYGYANRYELYNTLRIYAPEKSREHYYAKYYNNIIMYNSVNDRSNIDFMHELVLVKKYNYAFTILSSLIDASKDINIAKKKNRRTKYLVRYYDDFTALLNIMYRKGSKELKQKMKKWVKYYYDNDCFGNLLLEFALIRTEILDKE